MPAEARQTRRRLLEVAGWIVIEGGARWVVTLWASAGSRAEPWDQAVRQARVREARRATGAAENRLKFLETRDATVDADPRALVEEAFGAGLIECSVVGSRERVIADLLAATRRSLVGAPVDRADLGIERRLELQERQTALRRELRGILEERAALQGLEVDRNAYSRATGPGKVGV